MMLHVVPAFSDDAVNGVKFKNIISELEGLVVLLSIVSVK